MESLENLTINRLIVQEAPLQAEIEGQRAAVQSHSLLDLPAKGSRLLTKRLCDSMGSDSHSVELSIEHTASGSAFDLMTRMLDSLDKEFIESSQVLAGALTRSQIGGSIRPGIAVILDGTVCPGGSLPNRFVAVLKAESDSGFVKEARDGEVLLKYMDDLVLGAQQRLYKIGFLLEMAPHKRGLDGDVRSAEDFMAYCYDHQMSNGGRSDAAKYFYRAFLGCGLAENAPRQTRSFFEATRDFINDSGWSAEDRYDAKQHLVSYLKSQEKTVSAKEFGDKYLPPAARTAYTKHVHRTGFPQRRVSKDLSWIKGGLRSHSMLFSSKVRITVPDGDQQLVKIMDENDQETVVKVAGRLLQTA